MEFASTQYACPFNSGPWTTPFLLVSRNASFSKSGRYLPPISPKRCAPVATPFTIPMDVSIRMPLDGANHFCTVYSTPFRDMSMDKSTSMISTVPLLPLSKAIGVWRSQIPIGHSTSSLMKRNQKRRLWKVFNTCAAACWISPCATEELHVFRPLCIHHHDYAALGNSRSVLQNTSATTTT